MNNFTQYIALGDSISIDLYPSLDLGHAGPPLPVGAASLLYRNHDATWPEPQNHDLSTRFPAIALTDLTADGATTMCVLSGQLHEMKRRVDADAPSIVTLTIGGNDLLMALQSMGDLGLAAEDTALKVTRCVQEIARILPNAIILVTTVYDPTDGTGNLPGVSEWTGQLPIQHLYHLNDRIRDLADGKRVLVADAQQHFHGHGVTAPRDEWWYWTQNPIEPSARGANALRELWLETLDESAIYQETLT